MSVEVIISCPLGHICEEVKDGALHRCAWLTKLKGKDPQSEQEYDEWKCAIAWLPIVGVQNSQTNVGQTQAIEKLHGTVSMRQALLNSAGQKKLGEG